MTPFGLALSNHVPRTRVPLLHDVESKVPTLPRLCQALSYGIMPSIRTILMMNARPKPLSIARSGLLTAALFFSSSMFPAASVAAAAEPSPSDQDGALAERAEPNPEPTPAEAPSQSVDPITGSLRVKVAPAIDDAGLMPTWITERNPTVEQSLALPEHEQWIEVEIGGATYAYEVAVTPMRDGAPIGTGVETVTCECNSQELLERIDAEVRRAVETLKNEPLTDPVEEPEGATPIPPIVDEPTTDRRTGLTWVGKTGVALVALGGAGVISGAVMVGLNQGEPLSDGYGYLEPDWRKPTGFVLLGVGGALLVGGVVPLVLDVTRCKRKPARCDGTTPSLGLDPRRRGWAWAPWANGRHTGMSLSGRF